MLSPEQTEQIKKQIIQQIETNFPEDKKAAAKGQIETMNPEQFETFLKQNKLIKESTGQQCVFCSIMFGDIPSYKIDENDKALAVLEINPVSKGHSLVIPKEHIPSEEKLPKEIFSLAEEVSKKIKTKLKPKEVNISNSNLFGHEVVNVIPVYEDETIKSERKPLKPEELLGLQKLLEEKQSENIPKRTVKKIKPDEKLWLPKRIP